MEGATLAVSRTPRSVRRQGVLVCAYSAYLGLVAAAVLGLVSLFASTGGAAIALLLVAAVAIALGSVLWLVDARAQRHRPMAPVIPLRPSSHALAMHGRRATRSTRRAAR